MDEEQKLPVPEGDEVAEPDDELETELEEAAPELDSLEETTNGEPDEDSQESAELKGEDDG
jgi:hypothetical protein